jgi:hypothetical protein
MFGSNNKEAPTRRFVSVMKEPTTVGDIKIIKDSYTGVQYIIYTEGMGALSPTMSVLLNEEGKPLLDK